jgi:hypothetical protein
MSDELQPETKDGADPISGGPKLVATPEVDIIGMLYQRMPEGDRLQFASQVLKGQPDQLAAEKHRRRERFRRTFTLVLVIGIIVDGLIALYFTEVSKSLSWTHMKDWLTLALGPLIAAATAATSFWFPSREAD